MLELKLRTEFLGAHMPQTAISLRTSDKLGAAEQPANKILSITYPTEDVLIALKAISTKKGGGRPIILLGGRGCGKSHIMAVMHHAISSPDQVENWLKGWSARLGNEELKAFEIVKGYFPISEPVQNHEYPFLWDLLFDRHPKGQYYRALFDNSKDTFPSTSLLEKMFQETPTCLILDEFQTWYGGLPDKHPKTGLLVKQNAFNFIQNLSEIARDHPNTFIFVVSVRDNANDAYNQVRRVETTLVNFQERTSRQDRHKLILHRLFENRRNISEEEISKIASIYANERFRLLYSKKSEAERPTIQKETYSHWPFSPELLDLLDNHILLSDAAQETRDLIRILAQVYRSRGESVPVITPSDFFVDGESDEVQTLVDSINIQGNQEKFRKLAQVNLEAIGDSGVNIPDTRELVTSIWMRSMSQDKTAGGTPEMLHLDITRGTAIDDNAFLAELTSLIENSMNIYGDLTPGGIIKFDVKENERSNVRVRAKNHKLWRFGSPTTPGMQTYPGKDIKYLQNILRQVLASDTTQSPSRVIILGPNWRNDPWSDVDEVDKPDKWDRPVLLVLPDPLDSEQSGLNSVLGNWLAKHVQKRRNTIRFLLPATGTQGLYTDDEVVFSARCSFLCSPGGWGSDSHYKVLHDEFARPLKEILKSRFNRFAILSHWNYQEPQKCIFNVEKIAVQGEKIPAAVEDKIFSDLFDRNEFKILVLDEAKESESVGSLLDGLIDPPPPTVKEIIPFLGETRIQESIHNIAAEGVLFLNVNGTWIGRRPEDTTDEEALKYIKSKAFRTGQELRQILLGLPESVGGGTITLSNDSSVSTPSETGEDNSPKTISNLVSSVGGSQGHTTQTGGNVNPSTSPVNMPNIKTKKSPEPTTGINLAGNFEFWGVSPNQLIETTRLEFSGLTVQQIKSILMRIPSTFRASMEINYKGEG